jgi:hypothetical protein
MAEYTLNLFDPAAEPPKQERGTITVSVEELTQTRNLVSHPLYASLPVTRAVACEMLAWLLFNSPRRVLPARIFLLSSRCSLFWLRETRALPPLDVSALPQDH